MRVTVSHHKPVDEAKKIVDDAIARVLTQSFPTPFSVADTKKSWNGDTMDFSLKAQMGMMSVPIQGKVLVTVKDIIIDVDLPGFLTKLLPEPAIKAGLESKVKGLLT